MGRKVVHGGETRNRIGADTRAKKHSRHMKREPEGRREVPDSIDAVLYPIRRRRKTRVGPTSFLFLHSFIPSFFSFFSLFILFVFKVFPPYISPTLSIPAMVARRSLFHDSQVPTRLHRIVYTRTQSQLIRIQTHTNNPISESSYPSVTKSVAAVILSQSA